jgi:hypothetical protein
MKRLLFSAALLLVTLAPLWADAPDVKKTVAWVEGLQVGNTGTYVATPAEFAADNPKPTLRATSSAVRTLKYLGGKAANPDKSAALVDSLFDKSTGGFMDRPGGRPDVSTTAVGIMAVLELKMPREKYVEPAVKFVVENARTFEEVRMGAALLEAVEMPKAAPPAWLETIAKLRNPDGTYGKGDGQARETGSATAAVLRLGGKVEQSENVLKALKAGQRPDGGFGKADAKGSDLESCYRVCRCFHMMKEKPDVKALYGFVEKCRNADGGYGVAPGEPSTISGTYYAAIIRYWFPA